jgi:hypothetical protein
MAATTPITKPTLTYGTRAGLAEPARVLLEDAGVDYDYVAIANWADVKAQYLERSEEEEDENVCFLTLRGVHVHVCLGGGGVNSNVPCERCVRLNMGDRCFWPPPAKRGRPPRRPHTSGTPSAPVRPLTPRTAVGTRL